MFEGENAQSLIEKIKHGEVILFLGAGASFGSTNGNNEPIPQVADLEVKIRDAIKISDDDLDLGRLAAAMVRRGEADYHRLIRQCFVDCTPADSLEKIFKYVWWRCYTLNYDDAIHRIPRRNRVQKFDPILGKDKVRENRRLDDLQVIHLNGLASRVEEGIVLTPRDYRREIIDASGWYRQCAQDYAERTFVFIGTSLNEPIFEAHIEALEGKYETFVRSFLITPSQISTIRQEELADMNIYHVAGTLEDFANWLHEVIGESNSSDDIFLADNGSRITKESDIESARILTEVGTPGWNAKHNRTGADRDRLERGFFSGMPPTWEIVASGIPTSLSTHRQVGSFLEKRASAAAGEICTIIGQSGSGKTTAVMTGLLKLAAAGTIRAFDIEVNHITDIRKALDYLGRLPGAKKILFIPALHVYVDEIERLSVECARTGVDIVAQVRQSDWSGRIGRRAEYITAQLELNELIDADYNLLADDIAKRAIAPNFRNLSRSERVQLLAKSNRQLLIAMMEATKQKSFDYIAKDEFERLVDDDAQAVFCMISLISISRSRLNMGQFESIINDYGVRKKFSEILDNLQGMISVTPRGSIVGRHNIFSKKIIDDIANRQIVADCIVAVLSSFTIYPHPYVAHVGPERANVLKFLMRAKFLDELFGKYGRHYVERIHEELEAVYQNDGHFWLQRGKYHQAYGRNEIALQYLERAVEAYPSSFQKHALARQRLIVCTRSPRRTPEMEAMLESATAELERQADLREDDDDEYPIVALASLHPEVLLRWGQREDAIAYAKTYFERLTVFAIGISREPAALSEAKKKCLHIATQGSLPRAGEVKKTKTKRNRRRRG